MCCFCVPPTVNSPQSPEVSLDCCGRVTRIASQGPCPLSLSRPLSIFMLTWSQKHFWYSKIHSPWTANQFHSSTPTNDPLRRCIFWNYRKNLNIRFDMICNVTITASSSFATVNTSEISHIHTAHVLITSSWICCDVSCLATVWLKLPVSCQTGLSYRVLKKKRLLSHWWPQCVSVYVNNRRTNMSQLCPGQFIQNRNEVYFIRHFRNDTDSTYKY